MTEVSAERAYLFRHPLLREASYQLQLPSRRARLHALALVILEQTMGAEVGALGAELAAHAAGALAQRSLKKAARLRLVEMEVRYRMQAAAWATKLSDLKGAIEQYQRIADHTLAAPRDAAVARWHLGVRQMAVGRQDEAQKNLEAALIMARKLDDTLMQVSVELELGNLALARSQPEVAGEIFGRALKAAHALGNVKLQSVAQGGLAGVAYRRGDYSGAVQGYRNALAASESAGDATNVAINLINLANALYQSDSPEAGLQVARDVCQRLEGGGLARLEVIALTNLANYLEDAGNIAAALSTLSAAEAVAARIGNAQMTAQMLDVRARIEMRHGRYREAARWLEQALESARENGRMLEEARCLARHAVALAHLKRRTDAQREWAQAVALFDALRSNEYTGELSRQFAEATNATTLATT